MNNRKTKTFSILTYNILAECLTGKTKEYPNTRYPYCKPEFLHFKYRSNLIIKEIQGKSPDIFCLQEIDNIEFYGDQFTQLGYQYKYMQKADRKEGIAIGFKKGKFKLVSSFEFLYNKEIPEQIQDKTPYLQQHQGILHFRLQSMDNSYIINILTTHLHHDPFEDHVKYFQICRAIQYINEVIQKEKGEGFIYCGDFNSMPESNVVQLMEYSKEPLESRLDDKFKKKIRYEDYQVFYDEIGKKNKQFEVKSVYSEYRDGKYPKFSNYKDIFQENIDYIFYDFSNLKVENVMELVKEEEILEYGTGIPNEKFPSDHIPLMAEFSIKNEAK